MDWPHVEIRKNNWVSYRMETKHKKTSQTKMEGYSGQGID